MSKCFILLILAVVLINFDCNISYSAQRKPVRNSGNNDKEYSHACQKVANGSYVIGSATSPGWLNQEEAICRSQRKYPEYIEASEMISGDSSSIEEMRQLYVMKTIWDNTPSLHTGVMSFSQDNFIKNEPTEFLGLNLGTKVDNIPGIIKSNVLGKTDDKSTNTPRINKDYTGSKSSSFAMYRSDDYEKGYYLQTRDADGSHKIVDIVLSNDPDYKDKLNKWIDPDAGFFAKLASNKVKPSEAYIPKNLDILGFSMTIPTYIFNEKDELVKIWGFAALRKNLAAELDFQDSSQVFKTLIDRLGEPALRAKNENQKFAVWVGKNGTRIDFLCYESKSKENMGKCVGGSMMMVQRSNASGGEKTGADFFK